MAAPTVALAGTTNHLHLDAYNAHTGPNSASVTSGISLNQGELYVATVQGTVSFYPAIDYLDPQKPFRQLCGTPGLAPLFSSGGGSGQVGEDPQFIFAYPAQACTGPRLPHVWSNFQANLGTGWKHPAIASPRALTRPSPDHLYNYGLVGRGRPVGFRLVDSDTRDDYGTLEISLRHATASDCAGVGFQAFGLSSLTACERLASGPQPQPAPHASRQTISQSPVTRVLRNAEVPSATNQQLPSGALDARQFADLGAPGTSVLHALNADGFASAAISEYHGGGLPDLLSTAIRYHNSTSAQAGLRLELSLAQSDRPSGTSVSVSEEPIPANIDVVTFTPDSPADAGGDELLLRAGPFVFSLEAVDTRDHVSLGTEVSLLTKVAGLNANSSVPMPR